MSINFFQHIPYPVIFGLLPLINFFAANVSEISSVYMSDFLTFLALFFVISAMTWLAVYALMKDRDRAALLATLLIAFLLTSGAWYYQFHESIYIFFLKITIKKPWKFLVLSLGLTSLLSILILKLSPRAIKTLSQFVAVYALILLIIPVTSIATKINYQALAASNQTTVQSGPKSPRLRAADNHPDIYYIILDEYANGEVLRRHFNFDNAEFLDALRGRGFYIAEESSSNYSQTALSIPSSLNLDYLDLHEKFPVVQERAEALKGILQENRAMRLAQANGYRTVNFETAWGLTKSLSAADLNVSCGSFNEFSFQILKQSIAGLFIKNLNTGRREQILCPFNRIPALAEKDFPKFVFAHVISPHSPYLFDSEGNDIEDVANLNIASEAGTQPKPYLAQLQYMNKKVLALVDEILRNSDQPPIIIIQSDHGTASQFPTLLSWNDPTPEMLIERMKILNAYYVPAEIREQLYPTITPVNTFRLVFNHLFNEKLPLLPDTNYYSSYVENRRWQFTNVSDIVQGNQTKP